MRLRTLAVAHLLAFAATLACTTVQFALIARSLAAYEFGQVLGCLSWATVGWELLDCRSWEILASCAKSRKNRRKSVFVRICRFEFVLAGVYSIIALALAATLHETWTTAVHPAALTATILLTSTRGLESVLRAELMIRKHSHAVWVPRVVCAVVSLAATAVLYIGNAVSGSWSIVLLSFQSGLLAFVYAVMVSATPDRSEGAMASAIELPSIRRFMVELIWSNLRGSGRLFVSRADRMMLPMLLGPADYAAYDCARRFIDRICGVGRPFADALLDRHLSASALNSGRWLLRVAYLLVLPSASIAVAVAIGAGPIARTLYGQMLGAAVAPQVILLSPLVLLMAQTPLLPLISTSESKRAVTVCTLAVAGVMVTALLMTGAGSVRSCAVIAASAGVAVAGVNFVAATRLVRRQRPYRD
jgi:O-antigen/teichoic acid export membrane protein